MPRFLAGPGPAARVIAALTAVALFAFIPRIGYADSTSKPAAIAHVSYIWHGLAVQPPHHATQQGKLKMSLYNQYFLHTGKSQRASLGFKDRTVVHMNQRTDAVLKSPKVTYVQRGEVNEILAPGTDHRVQTAAAVASAIGTSFLVKAVKRGTYFIVVHGSVRVRNKLGVQFVKTNEQSVVVNGQAPQPPQPVDAQAAAAWTNGMPNPGLGENVALDANGGSVVDSSSHYSNPIVGDFWLPTFINDGRKDFGWASATGQTTNQWIKLRLGGNKTYKITQILIDPAATHNDPPSADLKDFEIRVSTTGSNDASFQTVLHGTCEQKNSLQSFAISPAVKAKYVELYALNNYGDPDWVSVAELEVIGKPTT